jgi:beta-glucanase (GH16 family)
MRRTEWTWHAVMPPVFALRWLSVLILFPVLHAMAVAQTWNLSWSDEFDALPGTNIDGTKWSFDKGQLNLHNEIQFYCAPGDLPPCDPTAPNAYLDGSHLVIQQRLSPDLVWTSARLKTQNRQNVQYGRVEASIQVPSHAGLAPAFSMLGTDILHLGQPAAGGIDVMQNWLAIGPAVVAGSLRGEGYSGLQDQPDSINFQYNFPSGEQVDTSFHPYGIIWSPGMVQFYVDDPANVVFVRTERDIPPGTAWPFDNLFFIVLNLAIGGDIGGAPDPGTASAGPMLVDYVRYYQAEQVPGPTMTANPITMSAGQTGRTTINLSSTAGTGMVYLACTGAPAGLTCSLDSGNPLNPAVVDFRTSATAVATLVIGKSVGTAGITRAPGPTRWAVAGLSGMFAMVLLPFRQRSRRRRRLGFLSAGLLLGVLSLQGCGGSSTGPVNHALTVTAYTVSGHSSSVTIPLTIN